MYLNFPICVLASDLMTAFDTFIVLLMVGVVMALVCYKVLW